MTFAEITANYEAAQEAEKAQFMNATIDWDTASREEVKAYKQEEKRLMSEREKWQQIFYAARANDGNVENSML